MAQRLLKMNSPQNIFQDNVKNFKSRLLARARFCPRESCSDDNLSSKFAGQEACPPTKTKWSQTNLAFGDTISTTSSNLKHIPWKTGIWQNNNHYWMKSTNYDLPFKIGTSLEEKLVRVNSKAAKTCIRAQESCRSVNPFHYSECLPSEMNHDGNLR